MSKAAQKIAEEGDAQQRQGLTEEEWVERVTLPKDVARLLARQPEIINLILSAGKGQNVRVLSLEESDALLKGAADGTIKVLPKGWGTPIGDLRQSRKAMAATNNESPLESAGIA